MLFSPAGRDALARLTIFERDTCLLTLHELTFGPRLNGLASCPACGERIEMTFNGHDLCPQGFPLPDFEAPMPDNPGRSFRQDGCSVVYRLPTSADLLGVKGRLDVEQARRQLLEACLLSARRGRKMIPVSELPPEVLEAAVEHMGQDAPLADPNLVVTCPACGHTWTLLFDIASYFWSEICAWAMRLMHEVHSLAQAYGWREDDILAMSACRRRAYLELIGP